MTSRKILLASTLGLALAACTQQEEEVAYAPPPPPGAVAGTTAADRDGDGIVDGYYGADGMYYPYAPPAPPPVPVQVTRRGERG